MPKKLDDMVQALIRSGKPKDQAWAIATAQFKKMNGGSKSKTMKKKKGK